MPIYSSHCPACDTDHEYFARVDDRDDTPVCCGAATSRVITAAMVSVPQSFAYKCQMTGETVTTYRRRKYLMQQQGVVDARDFKDTWKRSMAKRAEEKAEVKRQMDALPESVKKAFQATSPIPG